MKLHCGWLLTLQYENHQNLFCRLFDGVFLSSSYYCCYYVIGVVLTMVFVWAPLSFLRVISIHA